MGDRPQKVQKWSKAMRARWFMVLVPIVSLCLLVAPARITQGREPSHASGLIPAFPERSALGTGEPANASTAQQPAENVELLGQIGGPTYAVAVQGNYAYVGIGPRLVVLDVSNPADPTMAGQTALLADSVQDVYVVGAYAFVIDGTGLVAVDVSNPAAPVAVGTYDLPCCANGVYVAGSHAYVAAGDAGLRVIDVSNPAAPVAVGFYETPGDAYDVYVVGDYAYVADGGGG